MHHGIATAIASDFLPFAGEIARTFHSEKQIWSFFKGATVSLPQRNRNLFPRKNRCVQFDRVNESQASTASHRRETVHLGWKFRKGIKRHSPALTPMCVCVCVCARSWGAPSHEALQTNEVHSKQQKECNC